MLSLRYQQISKILNNWGGYEIKKTSQVFLISFFVGIVIGAQIFQNPDQIVKLFKGLYASILNDKSQYSFDYFFFSIFQRNITAAFITIFLGLFYKYLPLVIIIFNSIIIGIFFYGTVFFFGGPLVFLRLLPHGIFEIPALIGACALGMRLARVSGKRGFLGKIEALFRSKNALAVIILLLLIAAAIESGGIVLEGAGQVVR